MTPPFTKRLNPFRRANLNWPGSISISFMRLSSWNESFGTCIRYCLQMSLVGCGGKAMSEFTQSEKDGSLFSNSADCRFRIETHRKMLTLWWGPCQNGQGTVKAF